MSENRSGGSSAVTGFYIETLLLTAVFITVILILTQVFAASRSQSREAQRLNDAVALAANAAELVAASDSAGQLLERMGGSGAAALDGSMITARFDAALAPDPEGAYTLTATWEETGGGLVESEIRVFGDAAEPIYTLVTAVYLGEGAAA